MKKWIVPIILFIAAIVLVAYLQFDGFSNNNIDTDAYLGSRSKIDSLQLALFNTKDNQEAYTETLLKLKEEWNVLESIREPVIQESAPVTESKEPETEQARQLGKNSKQTFIVLGIFLCLILIIAIILLLRKLFKKNELDDLDAQKAALSTADSKESLVIEERFRNPKGGFSGEDLTFTRTRGGKRPSIIDEANAYAEKEREKEKQKELLTDSKTEIKQTEALFAFEDSDGIPENRILSTDSESKQPTIPKTAKQRITNALQSLSSALTRPRGISRDQTMHLRTQSRNTMDLTLSKKALDVTRFDKEQADLTLVKKLKSQGCTPGMIAKKMNISENEAETLITKLRDSK